MALVIAVFAIADGANGQDHMDLGIDATKDLDTMAEVVGAGLYREHFFLEERLGALLAVIDNLASVFQTIDVIGAKGEEGDTGARS